MAPLAHTLALLAMTVATAAIEVLPLDMAQNSFDDQYLNCGPNMTKVLPDLNRTEFQGNRNFAQVWPKATLKWQNRGSPLSSRLSSAHAIALMAYTMDTERMYEDFNAATREAGSSPQKYRKKFHYKVLHFLLTQALERLRDSQEQKCYTVFRGTKKIRFQAQPGDIVRFGQFASTSFDEKVTHDFGRDTVFKVNTCHGADIKQFSNKEEQHEVLIPPFETFKVIDVNEKGESTEIELSSTGKKSKYNCEWLRGGSVPMVPFHLGGLLLTTTALAVATGIL